MRVGSTLSGGGLTAQHNLLRSFALLAESSVRLSTMKRINSGGDDPAGLIAMEEMQAELNSLKKASYNASRAAGNIQVADSGLSQVGDLLNTVRDTVLAAAGGGLSDAEVAAKQIEVDAALQAIDRIGGSTSFGGKNLLQGGSMTFALSPDPSQTTTLDLPEISTTALGGDAGSLSDLSGSGSLNLTNGDMEDALKVVDDARNQVLYARAEMGAFEKYTIESTQSILGEMEVNVSSALSTIRDTDFASETSNFIRAEIMTRTGISALLVAGQSREMIGELF